MSASKPFSCEVCSWTFTRSENLERHRRSRHGGAARMTFECPHCEAKFARRDICKRHSNRCQERSIQQPSSHEADATISFDGSPLHIQHNDASQDTSSSREPPSASRTSERPRRSRRRRLPTSPSIDPPFTEDNDETSIEPTFTRDIDLPTVESFWPVDLGDNSRTTRRHEAPVSPESINSRDSVEPLVTSYFEHFHTSLPLIHRPTFRSFSAPRPLLKIVMAIGGLYSVDGFSRNVATSTAERSRSLWTLGVRELDHLRSSDWRELRKTWVMQAWLLHIVFGAYAGDSVQYNESRQLLRSLVDAVRDLGLLNQAVATTIFQPTDLGTALASNENGMQRLEQTWISYVDEETLKLSLQTLLFLDHQVFSSCNMRPLLNPTEFVWELPLSGVLWEAEDAVAWRLSLIEQYGEATMAGSGLVWPIALHRGFYTTSTALATQSIMSESPCPQLIQSLFASPMATLAVLTNLELLVRDFTRCYYQLPPSPSDPSAYHILTQSQNRRVTAALKVLSKLTSTKLSPGNQTSNEPLWQSCDMIGRSIKLSLCKPDDLLIGGIVESSVIAALMTATHLTLGSYVAVRRSTLSLLNLRGGDEGTLAITEDLTAALAKIAGSSPSLAFCEAPWTTAVCYRILLLIWRNLRWAIAEIRENFSTRITSTNTVELPRSFGTCSLILNSLLETILLHEPEPEPITAAAKRDRIWAADPQILSAVLDDSESDLVNLIIHVCKARPVWAIGPAMAAAVDEIMTTTASSTSQPALHLG